MLIIGLFSIWLMYWEGFVEYRRAGDDYGAAVTAVAMFGSFLPFIGFALIMGSMK
jgi:hypothetical protein